MERVMGGKYDQRTLYMYENAVMKPTKNVLEGERKGDMKE
jgi:hypothetical protein